MNQGSINPIEKEPAIYRPHRPLDKKVHFCRCYVRSIVFHFIDHDRPLSTVKNRPFSRSFVPAWLSRSMNQGLSFVPDYSRIRRVPCCPRSLRGFNTEERGE